MIALLQRVTQAHVQVDGKDTGRIGTGLLALLGVERGDTEAQADRLLERLLTYRIFADDAGKQNLSLHLSWQSIHFQVNLSFNHF